MTPQVSSIYRVLLMALVLLGTTSHCDRRATLSTESEAEVDKGSDVNPDTKKPAEDLQDTEALLQKDQVTAALQSFWPSFHASKLSDHPLAARLDELVKEGAPQVKKQACSAYAQHVGERLAPSAPELLLGELKTLQGRSGDCWTLHYDGMMGPGLGAALTLDGEVLFVWIIAEG